MTKDDAEGSLERRHTAERRKVTLSRVGWGGAKTGAGVVAPVVGPLTIAGLEALVDHVRRYRDDRGKERLERFVWSVLEGTAGTELKELLDREIEESDYHAVLTAVVNEEEDEKTELYARVLRSILRQEIPEEDRRYVIRTVSSLSFGELELARRVYVHAAFLFPTYGAEQSDPEAQVAGALSSRNPLQLARVRTLLNHGLLRERDPGEAAEAKARREPSSPLPTGLLEEVVRAAYADEQLRPEAIGRKERSPIAMVPGVFIAMSRNDHELETLTRLSEKLYSYEIQNVIATPYPDRDVLRSELRRYRLFVLPASEMHRGLASIRETVDMSDKLVAVILPTGANDDQRVSRDYTIDIRSESIDQAFDRFARWANERIREMVGAGRREAKQ